MADIGAQSIAAEDGPQPPTDRVSEWLRLLHAARALCESLEGVVAPFGLMLRDYELLRVLPGRVLSQTAVVRQLDTNKVSVSRGVRRLSAEGWLSITVSSADKRLSWVSLTEAGLARLAEVEMQVSRFLEALAAALDEEQRDALGQINEALRRSCQLRAIDAPCAKDTG
jgi:DNA-binding MarR family transcriptional regulator